MDKFNEKKIELLLKTGSSLNLAIAELKEKLEKKEKELNEVKKELKKELF